jgi:phosphate starvation-inducible PhoH-like protein
MTVKKRSARRVNEKEILDLHNISKDDWELDFHIKKPFKLNNLQQEFFDTIINDQTQMSFVDGPAGSAKTYIGVLAALRLLSEKKIKNIVYIRSIVESANRSMGALPGEIEEKFKPWSAPLIDKLEEIIDPGAQSTLMSKGYIKCIPVNFTRGLTFRESAVIVDEAQNMTKDELTTVLTRFGEGSKYIIVGDSLQSDINGKSGFNKIQEVFDSDECRENGIFAYKFTDDDVVRSKILKYIVARLAHIS